MALHWSRPTRSPPKGPYIGDCLALHTTRCGMDSPCHMLHNENNSRLISRHLLRGTSSYLPHPIRDPIVADVHIIIKRLLSLREESLPRFAADIHSLPSFAVQAALFAFFAMLSACEVYSHCPPLLSPIQGAVQLSNRIRVTCSIKQVRPL